MTSVEINSDMLTKSVLFECACLDNKYKKRYERLKILIYMF